MRRRTIALRLVGVLAGLGLAVCLTSPVSAQAVSGTILGTVRDSSGAAVPGATVTLVQTATGYSRSVVSNALGEYTAPSLPTGAYSVSGEITGFKKVSLANVQLGVDQKVRIDLTHVREFHDYGVTVLAQALASRGKRIVVRGLRQHHLRLLRYFGSETGTTNAAEAELA